MKKDMQIIGTRGLSNDDIAREIEHGARFIVYTYAISIIVLTFRRPSSIVFVKAGESRFIKGLKYSLATIVLGWWGFPWGPIYSIGAIGKNSIGGNDVTPAILDRMGRAADLAENRAKMRQRAKQKQACRAEIEHGSE